MSKYTITTDHHSYLGAIGTVIELSDKEHGQTPNAAYLRAVGKDTATTKPAVISVGRKEK